VAITENTVEVEDLDAAIEEYRAKGWRLDMIFPADSPREAIMSAGGGSQTVKLQKPAREQGRNTDVEGYALADARASASEIASNWSAGRAGMMYRDLIPGRVDGKVIASHIKLLEDGPVADYVHYHKVEFQMIYCLKGRIEVVYEDQGPPFWLEPGDCVVQPPEIRHRVLFAEGNAEVLELTMPAEHETWIDHELELPNSTVNKARMFNGQRFSLTKAPI